MSAPSDLHEVRVGLLSDLATLSGYSVEVHIACVLRPDISRIQRACPRLLIADAKASESPSNTETRLRLRRYATAAWPWLTARNSVDFAICHDPDPAEQWVQCLREVVESVGLAGSATSVTVIEPQSWVTRMGVRFHDKVYRSSLA